jgi:hypothetical protein
LLHPQVAVGQGDGLQRLEQRRDGDARQQYPLRLEAVAPVDKHQQQQAGEGAHQPP